MRETILQNICDNYGIERESVEKLLGYGYEHWEDWQELSYNAIEWEQTECLQAALEYLKICGTTNREQRLRITAIWVELQIRGVV